MDQHWREDAACLEIGSEMFFPPPSVGTLGNVKRICERFCPVREECLEFGVVTFQHYGIWGGKTERTLRRIRKERGLVEPAEEAA